MKRLREFLRTPEAMALLAILLFLSCLTQPQAQTFQIPPCDPKTSANPNAAGSHLVQIWSIDAYAWGVWCPTAPPPVDPDPTMTYWKAYTWAGLFKYLVGTTPTAVATQITHANDQPNTALVLMAAGAASAVDAMDLCTQKKRRQEVCHALTSPPFAGVPFTDTTATPAWQGKVCGPIVDCAGIVVPETWRVAPSGTATQRTAYERKADGSRGTPDGWAKVREACDCSTGNKITEYAGLVTYCVVAHTSLVAAKTTPHLAACTNR
jgi:hypothetical protein